MSAVALEPRLVARMPGTERPRRWNPLIPNLVIKHRKMGFPPGAIIPKRCLPNEGKEHFEIGAVDQTTQPATHGVEAAKLAAPASATAAVPVIAPVPAAAKPGPLGGGKWDVGKQTWCDPKTGEPLGEEPSPTARSGPTVEQQLAGLRDLNARLEGHLAQSQDRLRAALDKVELLSEQLRDANDLYKQLSDALGATAAANAETEPREPREPLPVPPRPTTAITERPVDTVGRRRIIEDLAPTVVAPPSGIAISAAPWANDVIDDAPLG